MLEKETGTEPRGPTHSHPWEQLAMFSQTHKPALSGLGTCLRATFTESRLTWKRYTGGSCPPPFTGVDLRGLLHLICLLPQHSRMSPLAPCSFSCSTGHMPEFPALPRGINAPTVVLFRCILTCSVCLLILESNYPVKMEANVCSPLGARARFHVKSLKKQAELSKRQN